MFIGKHKHIKIQLHPLYLLSCMINVLPNSFACIHARHVLCTMCMPSMLYTAQQNVYGKAYDRLCLFSHHIVQLGQLQQSRSRQR